jgi:hypothetical protein
MAEKTGPHLSPSQSFSPIAYALCTLEEHQSDYLFGDIDYRQKKTTAYIQAEEYREDKSVPDHEKPGS